NLTPLGGEPHDLELSPAVIRRVSRADLDVVQSGFQPAVDQTVLEGHPARTLDATAVLEAAPAAEPALPPHDDDHVDSSDEYDELAHDEEPSDEDDHDHDAGRGASHVADDGHVLGGVDPHSCLVRTRLALLAPAVADTLAAADPAGA